MFYAALVLAVIEAGVVLGRKIHEIVIDKTYERPLALPIGTLIGDLAYADAREFFGRPENAALVEEDGPFFGILGDQDKVVAAYRTVLHVNERVGGLATDTREATNVVRSLHRFGQVKDEYASRPVAQRLLGTIVEIGVDYFSSHPEALGSGSAARRLIQGFIENLDDVDFAEDRAHDIAADVLRAGLRALDGGLDEVLGDDRVGAILGGVTKAALDHAESNDIAAHIRQGRFLETFGESLLRGAAMVVVEDPAILVQGNGPAKQLVRATTGEILRAVVDSKDLFSPATLEAMAGAAVGAMSENVDVVVGGGFLSQTIAGTLRVLQDQNGGLVDRIDAGTFLADSLRILTPNLTTLIDPANPQRNALVELLDAVQTGLGDDARELLTRDQLQELLRAVVGEVAEDPARLLGPTPSGPASTALAQALGSLAQAVAADPHNLANGRTYLAMAQDVLRVTVDNADKLIDVGSDDVSTNLLHGILRQVTDTAVNAEDPRALLSPQVVSELVSRLLPLASRNADRVADGSPIATVLEGVLDLAAGDLSGRIDRGNLAALVEGLLGPALEGVLSVQDPQALAAQAKDLLRAAA